MEGSTTKNGLEMVATNKSGIGTSDELLDQVPEVRDGTIHGVHSDTRGVKRPAEDEDDDGDGNDDDDKDTHDSTSRDANADAAITAEVGPISKNRLKKLKRQKRWEEKKQHLKEARKEKRRDRRERKKLEKEAEIAAAAAEGRNPVLAQPPKRDPSQRTQVPVTVIIDCQFEKYMLEKELVSLCSQVTRCYSDNKSAPFPVHTFISSYSGAMKTRFETALVNMHQNWKGIHFREADFTEVAREAKELMAVPQGGKKIELLEKGQRGDSILFAKPSPESKKHKKPAPLPEPEADDVDKSIVYLTADSPYTLERLEPNTCYVIGGIIDKNREKGLCYKLAREKKVRTAKLPIGEFMVMQSRHILATNHVMDIILKYLELGDWGEAFMKVIPPRKGGKLKDDDGDTTADHEEFKEDGGGGNGEAEAGLGKEEQDDTEMQEEGIASQVNQPSGDVTEAKGAGTHEPEVEGATSEEGLQKNALGEKEWSAPPIEREKIPDLESTTKDS